MKTWHWVVILIVVAIVVVGIVLFMYGYFPRPFVHGGKYRAINQYEVFRDLLITILTIAGLFIALVGAASYRLISKNLGTKVEEGIETFDTKVEESTARLDTKGRELDAKVKKLVANLDAKVGEVVDEQVNYAMATILLELSYDSWGNYEVRGEPQKKNWNQLESAIDQSKRALERAEELDTKQRKFEYILCIAKNNLAYHLAARNYPSESEKAISLAKYSYDRIGDFDFEDTSGWMDTYAFVLIRMGTHKQKTEGKEIVKELRGRRYLPNLVRDSVDKKYTKNLFLKRIWREFKKPNP